MKNEVKISENYISVLYNGIPSYGGSQLWFDGNMRKCGCGVIAAADVLLYLKQRAHAVHAAASYAAAKPKTSDKSANISYAEHYTPSGQTDEAVTKYNTPAKRMLLDSYIKYVEKIRPAFPLIPGRGMPCFMLALYLKIYMSVTKMPYRICFGAFFAHPASAPATPKAADSSPAASDDGISDNKITARAAGSPVRLVRSLFRHAAARNHISIGAACESRLRSCICDMLAHDIPVILCIGPGVHQFMKPKAERGIMLYSRSETVRCSSGRLSYFTYTPVRRVRSHFVVITELSGDYTKVSSWGKPYYISVDELARYSKLDMFGLFTNVVRIHSHLSPSNSD